MHPISHRLLRRAAALLAGALLALALVPAAASAAVTALERSVINSAHGELVEGVHEPNNDNRLSGNQPYDIGAPWCGSFVDWVMRANGVVPKNWRRTSSFNPNVAKHWAYYGPKNGGYGRWASSKNAMPGDLLVLRYDGKPTTGGHVTMVVATTSDRDVVWTIGGNEGHAVRLQKRTLSKEDRAYLVTLAEFRTRTATIWGDHYGAPKQRGTITYERKPNSSGWPTVKATKVVHNGKSFSGSGLSNSGFRVRTNSFTASVSYRVSTRSLQYVVLEKGSDSASMAVRDPNIDWWRKTTATYDR